MKFFHSQLNAKGMKLPIKTTKNVKGSNIPKIYIDYINPILPRKNPVNHWPMSPEAIHFSLYLNIPRESK